MSKRRYKSGYKTHDVTAEWQDEQGNPHRELVGMRSYTDTGESIEIFFRKFPVETSTIIAIPIKKE